MTGFAGQSRAVFLGIDLREIFGLGGVRLVAANAENGCVELRRLDRARIARVCCERAVTSFAVHACMLSILLHGEDIGVASLADFVSGKHHRFGSDFGDRIATVVAVLTETPRHEDCSDQNKDDDSSGKDQGDTPQMFRVLEPVRFHWCTRLSAFSRPVQESTGAETGRRQRWDWQVRRGAEKVTTRQGGQLAVPTR